MVAVGSAYASERKVRILGAHKPGASRFVKNASILKPTPEMRMPTLLTGEETLLEVPDTVFAQLSTSAAATTTSMNVNALPEWAR